MASPSSLEAELAAFEAEIAGLGGDDEAGDVEEEPQRQERVVEGEVSAQPVSQSSVSAVGAASPSSLPPAAVVPPPLLSPSSAAAVEPPSSVPLSNSPSPPLKVSPTHHIWLVQTLPSLLQSLTSLSRVAVSSAVSAASPR